MDSRTLERVTKHGEDLKRLFHLPDDTDPVSLCRKLRRLERQAEEITTHMCNGTAYTDEAEGDAALDAILAKVDKLLGFHAHDGLGAVPVFINRDPRGYALKIEDEWMREHDAQLHRDWGGYGILAPDLTEG
jgi:hypothetical protein